MSVTLHRIRSCFCSVLVLFAVFFAPTVVAAQGGGIAGTVTDEASGSALSAVQVEVVNASGAVGAEGITGPSGSFRINDIPSGNYTVRFNSAGWGTVTLANQQVSSGQGTTVSVSMAAESFSLNPLTVTVSKTEEKVLDAPAAISVVQALSLIHI